MGEFGLGDRVHVELDGVIIRHILGGIRVSIQDGNGRAHFIDVPGSSEAQVTLLEPDNWPPQPGDIWEISDGREFSVRRQYFTPDAFFVESMDGQVDPSEVVAYSSPSSLDDFRALSPRLVRRRGQ